ncbi:circadian clock protein KaiC [Agrobacterium fabrum]|uniref:Circadian clock protein KaiC n=1 Tax=Agrobacterium fabrum TaxID=1176649 RepID=A0A7Z7FTS8_9HYPH|nr:DUF982 domain-containing protein [Agrobacterium fabrum]SDK33037.1 circadian clock protein KaiC [Agrobacterium fabrum]
MALELFDRPLYALRKYFVQEITGLDDVFDFLDEWPEEKRDLAYDVMMKACRMAANRELPVSVIAENFQRFLKRYGKLADVEHLPVHVRHEKDRNISNN